MSGPRVSFRLIEAHRLRARARKVREADGRAFWISTADRERRARLADLMDAAAAELERRAEQDHLTGAGRCPGCGRELAPGELAATCCMGRNRMGRRT